MKLRDLVDTSKRVCDPCAVRDPVRQIGFRSSLTPAQRNKELDDMLDRWEARKAARIGAKEPAIIHVEPEERLVVDEDGMMSFVKSDGTARLAGRLGGISDY